MSARLAEAWFDRAINDQTRALEAGARADCETCAQSAFDALGAAMSLGSREALFQLGVYYRDGEFRVVPARADLAEHWFRLGAAAKDPAAMMSLGVLFVQLGRRGQGRRWLRKALAHGDGGAACHLGREYEEKAPARALRWYLKGVALGDPFAAECAARVLESRGSRRALLRAATLYETASRQFPDAAEALARVRFKLNAPDRE